jgi:hypothetical protein
MVLALCACGDKKAKRNAVPATVAIAPTVSSATAVSTLKGRPPLVVMIAGPQSYMLATAASWDTLARRELDKGPVKVHPTQVKGVFAKAVETFALERPPEEDLKYAGEESLIDLSEEPACKDGVDTHGDYAGGDDDPPPPEEEDKPDDGAEESGGTGTAMAMEEGKMGKRDSDRAEGQYKMRGPDPDRGAAIDPGLGKMGQPDTDRDIAQYKMRKTAPNESPRLPMTAERHLSGFPGTGPVTWQCLDSLKPGMRRAQARGDIDTDGALDGRPPALILVEPHAMAGLLVDALEQSRGGAIGVTYQGAIRPLALRFDAPAETEDIRPPAWIEVRVLAGGLEIGGPGVSAPTLVPDAKTLAAAVEEVRHRDMLSSLAPVDVLVAADVEAQKLVDVLVALIETKAGVVGLGHVPK